MKKRNLVCAPLSGLAVCLICGRKVTDGVTLQDGRVRHFGCAPGSPRWVRWYEAHPDVKSEAGDRLYEWAKRKEAVRVEKDGQVCSDGPLPEQGDSR